MKGSIWFGGRIGEVMKRSIGCWEDRRGEGVLYGRETRMRKTERVMRGSKECR